MTRIRPATFDITFTAALTGLTVYAEYKKGADEIFGVLVGLTSACALKALYTLYSANHLSKASLQNRAASVTEGNPEPLLEVVTDRMRVNDGEMRTYASSSMPAFPATAVTIAEVTEIDRVTNSTPQREMPLRASAPPPSTKGKKKKGDDSSLVTPKKGSHHSQMEAPPAYSEIYNLTVGLYGAQDTSTRSAQRGMRSTDEGGIVQWLLELAKDERPGDTTSLVVKGSLEDSSFHMPLQKQNRSLTDVTLELEELLSAINYTRVTAPLQPVVETLKQTQKLQTDTLSQAAEALERYRQIMQQAMEENQEWRQSIGEGGQTALSDIFGDISALTLPKDDFNFTRRNQESVLATLRKSDQKKSPFSKLLPSQGKEPDLIEISVKIHGALEKLGSQKDTGVANVLQTMLGIFQRVQEEEKKVATAVVEHLRKIEPQLQQELQSAQASFNSSGFLWSSKPKGYTSTPSPQLRSTSAESTVAIPDSMLVTTDLIARGFEELRKQTTQQPFAIMPQEEPNANAELVIVRAKVNEFESQVKSLQQILQQKEEQLEKAQGQISKIQALKEQIAEEKEQELQSAQETLQEKTQIVLDIQGKLQQKEQLLGSIAKAAGEYKASVTSTVTEIQRYIRELKEWISSPDAEKPRPPSIGAGAETELWNRAIQEIAELAELGREGAFATPPSTANPSVAASPSRNPFDRGLDTSYLTHGDG